MLDQCASLIGYLARRRNAEVESVRAKLTTKSKALQAVRKKVTDLKDILERNNETLEEMKRDRMRLRAGDIKLLAWDRKEIDKVKIDLEFQHVQLRMQKNGMDAKEAELKAGQMALHSNNIKMEAREAAVSAKEKHLDKRLTDNSAAVKALAEDMTQSLAAYSKRIDTVQ